MYDSNFLDNIKYSETTGKSLTDNTNKMANKILQLGHACNYLYLHNKQRSEEFKRFVEEITKEMRNKVSTERYEKEVQNMTENANDSNQKQFDDMTEQLKSIKKKYDDRLLGMQKFIDTLEKNTVWKITECQNLLKNRTSKQYVNDCCDTLEEKLSRQIEKYSTLNSRTILDVSNQQQKFEKESTEHAKQMKLELRKQIRESQED